MHTLRTILLATTALVFLSASCIAQGKEAGDNGGDGLVKWEIECQPEGCSMEAEVLRGYSGLPNPPEAGEFREYVRIHVSVDRKTHKPAYFLFRVDPRAQQDQGIFIAFTKTTKDGSSWKVNLDESGASRIPFERCSETSCIARVPLGLVQEGPESHRMDLLEKFLASDHLLVLYQRGGKAYRTMVILSSFKKEYQWAIDQLTAPEQAKHGQE